MSQSLIDEKSREMLLQKFQAELQDDVSLQVFVGKENKEYGDFAVQLVEELNKLDNRIKPTIYRNGDGAEAGFDITRTPTILIGWDKGYRIKYTGAPVGNEAGGFIETIALVSRGDTGLGSSSLEKLAEVDQEATIQVFVTPTCPYCPQSVLLANQIAIAARGKVTAECVEASQNMDLAEQFNVSSVPQQVINDDLASISIGAQPEAKFVDQVLSYSASRYEEIMAEELAQRAQAERLMDAPSGPVTLTDGNFTAAIEKYPALVVDCWAEWCAPCRMVAPIIDELAKEHQGSIVFGKLDVDKNQESAGGYGIMSIPTLLFFKNGEMVGSQVGALPRANLEAAIREHGLI